MMFAVIEGAGIMTEVDVQDGALRLASSETALQAVVAANGWVITAKRTHSPELLARAEKDLQAAVDGARDLGVQWGQIGSTLGIARGNAYQRYRKKLAHNDFPLSDVRHAQSA